MIGMRFSMRLTFLSTSLILLLAGYHQDKSPNQASQPVEVGVVTLQSQPITLFTQLPGRTTAVRTAEVRPQVNGIILKRLFQEGGDVKEGQPLYQIDSAS